MEIDIRQLPDNQIVSLSEVIAPKDLDLDVEGISCISPVEIKADIIKIQDAVDIKVEVNAKALMRCSLCLSDSEFIVKKNFRLDYPIEKQEPVIDITEDIRQEVILDYPMKPLCKVSCKGLCSKCGKNLNEGPCDCVN